VRRLAVTALRRAALAAIAVLVAAASLVSFAESYRALYLWAAHHGLHGAWAYFWPLQVDTFVAVGELALLVALADSWPLRSRVAAWGVTVLGLAVSVLGNVGHVTGHDLASRATAAVPPLAAAAALAVGLGVLKRVVAARITGTAAAAADVPGEPGSVAAALNGHAAAAAERFAADLEQGRVPSIRAIRSGLSIGQQKASQVQAYLRTRTGESP
jgi:Protein of unknown function (DUF2637)